MVYAQIRIHPGKWDKQILEDFEIQTDHQISSRRPAQVNKKTKENFQNSGSCRPEHKANIKEIDADHAIPTRRPYLMLIYKKK